MHKAVANGNDDDDSELRWYTSGNGRIEFQMTLDQARSASHQGSCDDDVEQLVKELGEQLANIDPAVLAAELKEYGA